MGIKLAGVDVSGIVAKEVGGGVLKDDAHDAVLIRVLTTGARSGNLTGGRADADTSHTCKGFIDGQAKRSVKGTLVKDGQVIINLIGDTISPAAVPEEEDKVTIEGATYRIKEVGRDPAAAVYGLLCRSV